MRALCLAFALLILTVRPAMAEAPSFHAGIARPTVTGPDLAGEAPFDILVWYPTEADEIAWQAGPFPMPATRNAAVAPGRFPVLLLSHGGGPTGGSPLLLRELSANLARHGFIVIAPFHGKTGLQTRVGQMRQALAAVEADPRFAPHLDPARLGMLGFSLGTAVTLEIAGAIPNPAHLVAYCAAHPNDAMSCDHAPDGQNRTLVTPNPPHPAPLPVKAIVLLDPFAVLFQRPELTKVSASALIFRPDRSELPAEANATALAAALPHAPEVVTIPGSHFVFTDACQPAIAASAPDLCRDPPGVDRAAVHAVVEARIAAFFEKYL